MYLYVELWSAKPAWLALSEAERASYMDGIGPAIGQLLEAGIELLGFAVTDRDALLASDHVYLGVWRMPTKEHALLLEQAVDGARWHDYFEQVNARGPIMDPAAALAHMIRGS